MAQGKLQQVLVAKDVFSGRGWGDCTYDFWSQIQRLLLCRGFLKRSSRIHGNKIQFQGVRDRLFYFVCILHFRCKERKMLCICINQSNETAKYGLSLAYTDFMNMYRSHLLMACRARATLSVTVNGRRKTNFYRATLC